MTDQPDPPPRPTPATQPGTVQGRCPACGGSSLFLGDGGYVTCARLDCPEPDAASSLLERGPDARAFTQVTDHTHTGPATACDTTRFGETCGQPASEHQLRDDDPLLTADEARNLVDELSTDLYRVQDAVAFVGECCDIADREQRPITTADVREWLKGARCGRQLAADQAVVECASEPNETGTAASDDGPCPAATDADPGHDYTGNSTSPSRCADCDTPKPASDDGLREQLVAAIAQWWDTDDGGAEQIADAVLAVRDTELQQARISARVASALHRSAEDTVPRVIELAERWEQHGPPPFGQPLAELRTALNGPASTEPADTQEQP